MAVRLLKPTPSPGNAALNFARFEAKFLMPNTLAALLEAELANFLTPDPFIEQLPERRYLVRSLYYDSADLLGYFKKVDGEKKRTMYRVRTYANAPSANVPVYLELKGRCNQLVYKYRTPLTLTEPEPTRCLLSGDSQDDVISRFMFDFYKQDLRPLMLIDYLRRAYYSKSDPEFRLTFDSHVQAARTRCVYPKPHENAKRLLLGATVVEAKYQRTMPAWFQRVLRAYGLRRVSVSKYVHAIQDLGVLSESINY